MADIKIKNLVIKYEPKRNQLITAIDNLNLDIKDKTLNVIVGYSGCGKTTLLRAIAGLQIYEGTILINGVDSLSLSIKDRNISLVNQNYALYPSMTIFENIAFPLTINGCSKEEIIDRVNDLAERLGIKHCLTRKPKHISGGQQQRAALARALIKKPNLYLFDEPLSNFDAQTRIESRILIKQIIHETQSTALYVTHDIYEALALADNLIVMNEGKVEISGTPDYVFNSPNPIVESLKAGMNNDNNL